MRHCEIRALLFTLWGWRFFVKRSLFPSVTLPLVPIPSFHPWCPKRYRVNPFSFMTWPQTWRTRSGSARTHSPITVFTPSLYPDARSPSVFQSVTVVIRRLHQQPTSDGTSESQSASFSPILSPKTPPALLPKVRGVPFVGMAHPSVRPGKFRKPGNPNWGKPGLATPAVATEFDTQARRLGLSKQDYADSRALRRWCECNRNRCYIPEWLIDVWGIPVNPSTGE